MPGSTSKLFVLVLVSMLTSSFVQASASGPDTSFFRFLTPKVTTAQKQALAKFPAFTVGPIKGPTVDILFIPGCPHCQNLWENLQELRETEPRVAKYRYRWIPMLVNLQDAEELLPFWKNPRDGRSLAALMSADTPSVSQTKEQGSAKRLLLALRPSLVWLRNTGAQMAPALIRENARHVSLHIGSPALSTLNRWLGVVRNRSIRLPGAKS